MAYMIYHTSKHQNFEVLLNDECDDATLDLFLQLLEVYPIPKLAEVKVRMYICNIIHKFCAITYRL